MDNLEIGDARIMLVKGDITKQETDVVVNAANSSLMGGGGVDGAIHRAGGPSILEECKEIVRDIGKLPPGQAVVTTAGNMPSKYVVHTVGPVWKGGDQEEADTLASCYRESMELAKEKGAESISFPSISTGAYGYPMEDAARVAMSTVWEYLEVNDHPKEVVIVLWGDEAYETHARVLEWLSSIKDMKEE